MHFITFSRQMGTKGTEIARLVAQSLQYRFYDTDDIEQKAAEMGFLDDIREINDKAPPPLKRVFSYRPEINLDHLYAVIYELARMGDAVILGRGGNMLFRTLPDALHVLVIASRGTRIRNLAERGYRPEAAQIVMEKSDRERESFVRFAFHQDWGDPGIYDLVLNMDKLSVTTAADLILCAARADEIRRRSHDTISSLDMMELSARVGAALAVAGFPSSYVSASVHEPGNVRLTGVVQVPWEKSEAERIALSIEGVATVENKIEIAGR